MSPSLGVFIPLAQSEVDQEDGRGLFSGADEVILRLYVPVDETFAMKLL